MSRRAAPLRSIASRSATGIRVLIVDDLVLFAEAVQMALRGKGIRDITILTDPQDVMSVLTDERRRPDVVLMDLGLPGESGLVLGARIVRRFPQIKVLALTGLSDPQLLREAMRMGFSGFLTKDTQVSRLVSSIRTVAEGEVVIPQALAKTVAGEVNQGHPDAQSEMDEEAALLASQLTEREREVISLLAEGAASPQIAERMHISRHTVRTHVGSVLGKLGVHSRLEAAAFAVRNGLVKTGSEGRA
jgi:DNA-binding NarL/FixJ family response regulator